MHSVVAIGVFDGLHLGHQALTDETSRVAAEFGLMPTALTFHPHPMTVVRGRVIEQLVSLPRRVELLHAAGMTQVEVCAFDEKRAAQSPAEFIAEVLLNRLNAEHVVVGAGFRFGKGAAGTAADLRAAGLQVHEVESVLHGGERVSSTRVRQTVAAGNIAEATALLTRPHRYQGIVVSGLKRGRDLGFPTANLDPSFPQAAPADGVYAGHLVALDSAGDETRRWPAAISVGTNPTFSDVPQRVVEAYAITDEDLDLYGQEMAVDFVERLRPMLAFDSVSELVMEMQRDVDRASHILGLR